METVSELCTFLIADVRGYTRFTQEYGDEPAAQLAARFADITEEVVTARGGRVVELRGDEAPATFTSARQALRAALDASTRQLVKRYRYRARGAPAERPSLPGTSWRETIPRGHSPIRSRNRPVAQKRLEAALAIFWRLGARADIKQAEQAFSGEGSCRVGPRDLQWDPGGGAA